MAPGNTCDGDLLSSISRDSCRQVTRVKLQWSPPAPWSCVVGAQSTAIVAGHQRLLLELTATLTLSWKKMFLGSIFPKSWSLLRHHPSLLQFLCISHTWGWLRPEETPHTVHPDLRTRGTVPVPTKAAMEITALCTVSAGSYESEAFWHPTLTSVHVVRIMFDRWT